MLIYLPDPVYDPVYVCLDGSPVHRFSIPVNDMKRTTCDMGIASDIFHAALLSEAQRVVPIMGV